MIRRQIHPVRLHDNLAHAFIVNAAQYRCRFYTGSVYLKVQVESRIITSVYRTFNLILPGPFRQLHHGGSLPHIELPVKRSCFRLRRFQKLFVIPAFVFILFYINNRFFQFYYRNCLFQTGKAFKRIDGDTGFRHCCNSLLLLVFNRNIFYQKHIASGPGYGADLHRTVDIVCRHFFRIGPGLLQQIRQQNLRQTQKENAKKHGNTYKPFCQPIHFAFRAPVI